MWEFHWNITLGRQCLSIQLFPLKNKMTLVSGLVLLHYAANLFLKKWTITIILGYLTSNCYIFKFHTWLWKIIYVIIVLLFLFLFIEGPGVFCFLTLLMNHKGLLEVKWFGYQHVVLISCINIARWSWFHTLKEVRVS